LEDGFLGDLGGKAQKKTISRLKPFHTEEKPVPIEIKRVLAICEDRQRSREIGFICYSIRWWDRG